MARSIETSMPASSRRLRSLDGFAENTPPIPAMGLLCFICENLSSLVAINELLKATVELLNYEIISCDVLG